jgi:hypothetical protein
MNYHQINQLLLGVAVLIAILLNYFGLRLYSESPLSPWQWLYLGALTFALIGMAFLPGIVRRSRGLPPKTVSGTDFRFSLALSVVLCPIVFSAVFAFGAFGSLLICVVPLAFAFRGRRQGPAAPGDRNG